MKSTDKKLFTPGPLNCSPSIKKAMLKDLGSRDQQFIQCVKEVKQGILDVAGVSPQEWSAVLMQGSGTFAVEAVLQTASPRKGAKVLVLANGAYGKRMAKICTTAGIDFDLEVSSEVLPVNPDKVTTKLKESSYSMVAVVHCETSSGVMNPVEKIGELVRRIQPNAFFFVDAMSSFGAVPLSMENIDFLVSSANKCLQGVPGFAYAVCRRSSLLRCEGNSRSLSLDLVDQDKTMDTNGQFRFTPPTHTILAFKQALVEFDEEGGLAGRAQRYKANREILRCGMQELGFKELVPQENAGYIITCFHYPQHPNFSFEALYGNLSDLGQVIYPGKVTDAACFRIGNIGDLNGEDMKHMLSCMRSVLEKMKVPIPVQ